MNFQVLVKIRESRDPEVSEAKEIMKRILNRDLYRSVVKITTKEGSELRDVPEVQIMGEIRSFVQVGCELQQELVNEDVIIIVKRKVDMGMGRDNPVKKVIPISPIAI